MADRRMIGTHLFRVPNFLDRHLERFFNSARFFAVQCVETALAGRRGTSGAGAPSLRIVQEEDNGIPTFA